MSEIEGKFRSLLAFVSTSLAMGWAIVAVLRLLLRQKFNFHSAAKWLSLSPIDYLIFDSNSTPSHGLVARHGRSIGSPRLI